MQSGYTSVIEFWFAELEPKQWFSQDHNLDERIAKQFGALHQAGINGELYAWRNAPEGRLAEIIVLDQFSRNIFRSSAAAYSSDSLALVLAQEAVRQKADMALEPSRRSFVYMPYMHSESRIIHEVALQLFDQSGLEQNLKFEQAHKAIIDQFDRYPHRNASLGRQSTEAELEFLRNHSGF